MMNRLGIIGGMSVESTALYYTGLTAGVRQRLGGLHSPELLIWSVDFADIAAMQQQGRWDNMGAQLADIARRLERAGADAILLATNTMHKLAPEIEAAITVPFLHIADATGAAIKAAGCKRPGLLGTAYTMEQDFYSGRLARSYGLDVLVPEKDDRALVHQVIYDELCKGVVTSASRSAYEAVATRLVARGADSIILGCTEVGLLLSAQNVRVPVFDTVDLHVKAGLDYMLQQPLHQAAE